MPSKRYSFVRGLPPLMRGRTEFGGRATPGAMAASMMNRRPFSGNCTTCSFSTTVPRLAVSARTIGESCGHDRHLFLNVSDAEIEIDPRFFTGREANALAAHGFETGELDIEPVLAGRQARGGVDAVARGHHHSLQIRPSLRDRDGRAGNGGPGLIVHHAGDLRRQPSGQMRATRRPSRRSRR